MLFKKKTAGVTAEIRVRRCYGCGAILQDQDPNEAGYVPPEKFESGEETLCERCFKLRHYSTFKKNDFSLDYVSILTDAKETGALAVYVLNAFALEGSFLEGIGKYLPSNVLVVLNKRDVLPASFSDNYLKKYTLARLKKENIVPKDILLMSATKSPKDSIDLLWSRINELRDGKSVYFFGSYQVGKSSLINALLSRYSTPSGKMITTSPYPGTTLDVIAVPLSDEASLYDTPGIYNPTSFVSFAEPEQVPYLLPRTTVKPESYLSKPDQSFLFSNFARLDFDAGSKTDFVIYKSNDLTILRCKKSKADRTFQEVCGNVEMRPRTEKITSMSGLLPNPFKAIPGKRNVLRADSLFFVEFEGTDQEITVYAPKGVKVSLESAEL